MWTGEQAPPPGAAAQIFNLSRGSFAFKAKPQNPADSVPPATPSSVSAEILRISGRGNYKEAIFALGNGISRRKNQHPFPTRRSPGTIFMREGCGSLRSPRFFDSLCAGDRCRRRDFCAVAQKGVLAVRTTWKRRPLPSSPVRDADANPPPAFFGATSSFAGARGA